MAKVPGTYDILIKKEAIEEDDCQIVEEEEDYEDYSENVNNVMIKEEVMLPDADDHNVDVTLNQNVSFKAPDTNLSNPQVHDGLLHLNIVGENSGGSQNVLASEGTQEKNVINLFKKTQNILLSKGQQDKNELKFLCLTCGKTFFTMGLYQLHLRTHLQNKSLKESIPKDKLEVYESVKMFACTLCRKLFTSVEAMNVHYKTHAMSFHECPICKKLFTSKMALEAHHVFHENLFKCTECDRAFQDKIYLDRHRKAKHSKYCKTCGMGFLNESDILIHMLNCLIECTKCSKKFKSKESFNGHNCTNEVLIECRVCKKKFSKIEEYNEHVCSNEPVIECGLCKKGFDKIEDFNSHNCAEEISMECGLCKTTFTKAEEFNDHFCTIVEPTNCKVCQAKFNNQEDLDKHVCRGYELWECKLCKIRFEALASLNRHLNTHRIVSKPSFEFKCADCRQYFNHQFDYVEHFCKAKEDKKRLQAKGETDGQSSEAKNEVNQPVVVYEFKCWKCNKFFESLLDFQKHYCLAIRKLANMKNMKSKEVPIAPKGGLVAVEAPTAMPIAPKGLKPIRIVPKAPKIMSMFQDINTSGFYKFLIRYNGQRLFCCVVCKKKFYDPEPLQKHLLIHSKTKQELFQMISDAKELYECFQCKSECASDEALKSHLRLHSAKPPYKCNKCGKKNFTVASFRSHLIECSETELQRCKECQEVFLQEKDLNSHDCPEAEITMPGLVYTCSICKAEFSDKTRWYDHVKMHTDLYRCGLCQKAFKTLINLERHKFFCAKNKPFECGQCQEKFSTREGLAYHSKFHASLHMQEEHVKCWQCGVTFSTSQQLMIHASIHPDKRYFKCGNCERLFSSISGFDTHRANCKGKVTYDCEKCGKVFISSTGFNCHKDACKGKPSLQCEICLKTLPTGDALEHHLKVHENRRKESEANPFRCKICKETFPFRSALNQHSAVHDDELPFECELCKNRFGLKKTLADHVVRCCKDRPYRCGKCGRGFKFLSALRQHSCGKRSLRPRRKPRVKKRHECADCGLEFEFRNLLRWHKVKQHGKRGDLAKSGPMECSVCHRTFKYKFAFANHLRTHYLRKKFKCYLCKRQFQYRSSYTSHLMSHGTWTTYKCDFCKRKFFTKSELSEHISESHSNNRRNSKNEIIFKCKCGIQFESRELYKKHLASHSEEKLFECNECKKKFAFKIGLKTHFLKHFGMETQLEKIFC